mgnify:CR=1 FL=1
MTLSKFPTVMPEAVAASIAVADALRYVRDSSGDLTFAALHAVQEGLAGAKLTTAAALTEGQKQPAAAESFMAGLGGPTTLAAFYAASVDLEAKAAAWNVALAGLLSSLSADELIGLELHGVDPLSYKLIRHKAFIPAAKADPFRANQALAELIAAFEAVGAT